MFPGCPGVGGPKQLQSSPNTRLREPLLLTDRKAAETAVGSWGAVTSRGAQLPVAPEAVPCLVCPG